MCLCVQFVLNVQLKRVMCALESECHAEKASYCCLNVSNDALPYVLLALLGLVRSVLELRQAG